ncbi:MAG: uroporphyrinogen decarboxylase family protein [Actinomycetota bacterium]
MSTVHERVIDALELREPDRVPVLDLVSEYDAVYEILGKKHIPMGKLLANPLVTGAIDRFYPLLNRLRVMEAEVERFTHDRTAASVKLGSDAAWVIYAPMWRFRGARQSEDYGGRLWDLVPDGRGNMSTPMYSGGLIGSPSDWNAWDKRDLLRLPEKANRFMKRLAKDFGKDLFIFTAVSAGIFENSWQPLGFERFAVAARKEREFVRRLIRFNTDLCCMFIEAAADAGIPGYCYGDDMAYRSGPMFSPRTFEELFGDSLRRVTETAHAQGMKIIVHSCGNTYKLLEWFADCGFDGVHPLEPTAGMELAEVKRMVGDRMCPVGNIDVSHVLVDGSREEVEGAVRQAIRDAGPGGGYILAPNHSHLTVSVERLRWMMEAAHTYGRYPLVK